MYCQIEVDSRKESKMVGRYGYGIKLSRSEQNYSERTFGRIACKGVGLRNSCCGTVLRWVGSAMEVYLPSKQTCDIVPTLLSTVVSFINTEVHLLCEPSVEKTLNLTENVTDSTDM